MAIGDSRDFGGVTIGNVNDSTIVPDGTTLTDAIQSSSGIDIINIAQPDSNGLSNNSYSVFNISSSGLFLTIALLLCRLVWLELLRAIQTIAHQILQVLFSINLLAEIVFIWEAY